MWSSVMGPLVSSPSLTHHCAGLGLLFVVDVTPPLRAIRQTERASPGCTWSRLLSAHTCGFTRSSVLRRDLVIEKLRQGPTHLVLQSYPFRVVFATSAESVAAGSRMSLRALVCTTRPASSALSHAHRCGRSRSL